MAVLSLAVDERMAARRVEFEVPGAPAPQGSSKMVPGRGTAAGRFFVTSANPRLRPWRLDIKALAREALGDGEPLSGPVRVEIIFRLARPGHHFGRRGLKPNAPHFSSVRPDLDKLARAVADALKEACVIRDDSQIAHLNVEKVFDDSPGAKVVLEEL